MNVACYSIKIVLILSSLQFFNSFRSPLTRWSSFGAKKTLFSRHMDSVRGPPVPLTERLVHVVNLTNRLFVEINSTNISVADIGADHGFVACSLTNSGLFHKVYAIDCSPIVIQQTRRSVDKYVNNDINNSSIEVIQGDGVYPLLDRGLTSEVLLMSGMGAKTILSILSAGSLTAKSKENIQVKRIISQLNVKAIVIQLWPPDILEMLDLHQFLTNDIGFHCFTQEILQDKNSFYITSGFSAQSKGWKSFEQQTPSYSDVLSSFPLLKKEENFEIWKKYLIKQRSFLKTKVNQNNYSNLISIQHRHLLNDVTNLIDLIDRTTRLSP